MIYYVLFGPSCLLSLLDIGHVHYFFTQIKTFCIHVDFFSVVSTVISGINFTFVKVSIVPKRYV